MVSKGYADCPWYLSVSPLRLVSWAGGTRRASKLLLLYEGQHDNARSYPR
jgi:hypothetical protein